jgi:glycosyltransferase involved in cell wall biosynthesis
LSVPPFDATLVVSTRNRKDLLRDALASALRQTARLEILVLDDGSDDGTSEMVGNEFPVARLYRFEQSAGLIQRRNDAAQLATAPIIVSIDDDAAFPSPNTIQQTLGEFDDVRIGAVAIPFVNVRQDPRINQRSPGPGVFVTAAFIGTAHALRRDLFLQLNGYRAELVHQGEESDYCIRMLDAGHVVRSGAADPIHHFESPRRDLRRMDFYGRRNDILFAWQNVPTTALLPHLAGTTLNGLRYAIGRRQPSHMLRGAMAGYGTLVTGRAARRPVSRAAYRLFRELKTRGPFPLSQIEARLPTINPALPDRD